MQVSFNTHNILKSLVLLSVRNSEDSIYMAN